jgi:Purple acid Phosphatase, N-terminal domain
MKHKLLPSLFIGAMIVSLAPSFLTPLALADHGGDGGRGGDNNNKRGQSNGVQTQSQSSTSTQAASVSSRDGENGDENDNGPFVQMPVTQIATGTTMQSASGTVATSSMKQNDENQEQENEHNNNPPPAPSNADLNALIQKLSEIVARLEAQLQALLGVSHAPVISAVSTGGTTATSTAVSWKTDELTTGKVYLATSSPVMIATSTVVADSVFSTSHTFALTGLSASTTYFFVVEAKDGVGNTSRSSEFSFTTLTAVSVPPVISAITVTNASSTQAGVNWQTDVPASSEVFFSAVSPVNLAAASTSLDSTLVINHHLTLTGLHPSSTVFFVIQSSNAAGSTGTSSQQSFATTP